MNARLHWVHRHKARRTDVPMPMLSQQSELRRTSYLHPTNIIWTCETIGQASAGDTLGHLTLPDVFDVTTGTRQLCENTRHAGKAPGDLIL